MPKVKKQQRRKKFRYSVNRKRLNQKLKKGPSIKCKEIKDAWDRRKSVLSNLEEMGLVYDVNKKFKISGGKEILRPEGDVVEDNPEPLEPPKAFVVETIENDANAPRVRNFQLPKNQVQWITYLMTRYGDDYKAMARDPKNYYQETWKQIRAKVRTFKGIPGQFEEFLKSRASCSTCDK